MRRSFQLLAILFIAVFSQAQNPHPLPTIKSAELPFYPKIAKIARVSGFVNLAITTDGERVSKIVLEDGPPLLTAPAEANARAWVFEKHSPTTFSAVFVYSLITRDNCINDDQPTKIEPNLPARIDITGNVCFSLPENFGLDLTEPLRVFFTGCAFDEKPIPCDKFVVELIDGKTRVRPARFKEQDGREGFVVPPDFRSLKQFSVEFNTPRESFFFAGLHQNYLKGNWRVGLNHAPYKEEARSLARRMKCYGFIAFQWGEPGVIVTTPCAKP